MKNVKTKVKDKSEKKRNEKNEKVLKKNVTRKRRKEKKRVFDISSATSDFPESPRGPGASPFLFIEILFARNKMIF